MDPLIGVAGLRAALASTRPPALLDVRWRLGGPPGREAYERGHVPGARFVDLDRDLAAPPGIGGRHPLPPVAELEETMRRLGVRAGRAVVTYDQGDATAAARCWWTLRYLGHRQVRVLDGGYEAWVAAGGETSTDAPTVTPGDFVARPGAMGVLDAAGAADVARSGRLLDARAVERFRGVVEPVDPVAGHIPGALSAPTAENLEDGAFRSAVDLRDRFAGLGVDGSVPVGVYCGSGVTAAHEVLALVRAGIPAALYVGSWSDWITDPSRPIGLGNGDT